jgi:octaprenyl-diphosphate synthase
MQHGTAQQRELVRTCIENGDEQHFDEVLAAITHSGALAYTREQAEIAARRAADAIVSLPDSQFKKSLLELSAFAVDRNH